MGSTFLDPPRNLGCRGLDSPCMDLLARSSQGSAKLSGIADERKALRLIPVVTQSLGKVPCKLSKLGFCKLQERLPSTPNGAMY